MCLSVDEHALDLLQEHPADKAKSGVDIEITNGTIYFYNIQGTQIPERTFIEEMEKLGIKTEDRQQIFCG